MHENFVTTFKEAAQMEADNTSPIEAALIDLSRQQERAEKAVAVLFERLSPVLQPDDAEPVMSDEGKASPPQSPVVCRLVAAADDLRRLSRRIDSLSDRLDT